jgi:osmotically-inducible protein OsmY
MVQSTSLPVLPTRGPAGEDTDKVEAALPRVQSREDLRLAECIAGALRATGYGSLGRIAVTVHARTVFLEGRVPSYYLKQVAQATALSVPGAEQACNHLEVGPPS